MVTKVKEQILASENQGDEPAEEIVIREKIRVYPDSWVESFGEPVNMLIQQHYDGDWDVLRPATELKEMNIITVEELAALRIISRARSLCALLTTAAAGGRS